MATKKAAKPKRHAVWTKARGYPRWANGERVTVWEREGKPFFLALHHEDKDLPILVQLRWPRGLKEEP